MGTFGKVYQAHDTKHNTTVALKIIRSIDKYIDSAKIESEILSDIYKRQKKVSSALCVKMYSSFFFDDHYCLVFEPLGMSLYDFIKRNDHR